MVPADSLLSGARVFLVLVLAGTPHAIGASHVVVDVLSCADLDQVNKALVSDHVTARFAASVVCRDWVTISAVNGDHELRVEALRKEGVGEDIELQSVRFEVSNTAVTVVPNVRIIRSANDPSHPGYNQERPRRRRTRIKHGLQDLDGGALHVHDSGSVIFLGDLLLKDIEVKGSGAGMYINNSVVEVHGRAKFRELGSETHGGAVYTVNDGTLLVYGGITAIDNYAEAGGAVYNLGRIQVELENSRFEGNRASRGGALYNGWGANGVAFFAGARFKDNGASRRKKGGAKFKGEHIYNENYIFFGKGVTCTTGETAIYIYRGKVEMEGPLHFAFLTDGAIYVAYEPIFENLKFLQPPTFDNNHGGAGNCSDIAYQQLDGSFICA